jgi:hypothetical protein
VIDFDWINYKWGFASDDLLVPFAITAALDFASLLLQSGTLILALGLAECGAESRMAWNWAWFAYLGFGSLLALALGLAETAIAAYSIAGTV